MARVRILSAGVCITVPVGGSCFRATTESMSVNIAPHLASRPPPFREGGGSPTLHSPRAGVVWGRGGVHMWSRRDSTGSSADGVSRLRVGLRAKEPLPSRRGGSAHCPAELVKAVSAAPTKSDRGRVAPHCLPC